MFKTKIYIHVLRFFLDIDVKPEEEEKPQTTIPSTTAPIAAADLGPNLDRLWAYQCPLSKGRNVSCMAWNRVNPVCIVFL